MIIGSEQHLGGFSMIFKILCGQLSSIACPQGTADGPHCPMIGMLFTVIPWSRNFRKTNLDSQQSDLWTGR